MRMPSLAEDDQANTTSAALPLGLATIGMSILGVGAILQMLPLTFAGIGLAVIGFATYLIAASMDRADRRRRDAGDDRAGHAKAAFEHDREAVRPRNPLADEAVAALTGEGKGGIYPPLPSMMASGEIRTPEHHVPPPTTSGVWDPGAKAVPAGWDDGDTEVVFEEVPRPVAVQTVGGGAEWDALPSGGPPGTGRPRAAVPDPVERDFRVWPGAKDVGAWSQFTGESRPVPARHSEEDLQKAMAERRRRIADRLPTVGAILADVKSETERERLQREATRGKCSKCEAIIWAPKKRPIVLKCPGCGHKAKLY